MERSSITRWLFLGLAVFLAVTFGRKALFPSKASERQPLVLDRTAQVQPAATEEVCTIEGDNFRADLSTRGASLRRFVLTDHKFDRLEGDRGPLDLVTTTNLHRMPLRTDLRAPTGDAQQVPYDDLDWKLVPGGDKKSCTFVYSDATTSLKKVVSAGEHPYELAVTVEVTNLADAPRKHRFSIEQSSWRNKKEMESHLGRQSEWTAETITVTVTKPGKTEVERQGPGDFEPDKFQKPEFTSEHWRRSPGEAKAAAVGVVYFANIVMPTQGPGTPVAETVIEDVWNEGAFRNPGDDPNQSHVFRARAAYPEKELKPKETVTYQALAYMGPKDRDMLAAVDHGAPEVLNLGTFSLIAGWLVWYLRKLYSVVGSWGWAIVLLTITVRTALFPLTLTQIKSGMAMRKLKPEMDAINEKFKDDATQRGLAQQELWRKNNINPVMGCLPMLVQMPVWWALYTALQTAVELYHVPFGPVIPDLTSPGKYFIIPIVLGASSLLQQKLMPQQGDPQQQKMMMYMMPAIFTVMMLFLPAGLGVYMLTNSVLAIVQQLATERYLRGGGGTTGQIEVREKATGDGGKPAPALGKGKARVRG